MERARAFNARSRRARMNAAGAGVCEGLRSINRSVRLFDAVDLRAVAGGLRA